MRLACLQEPHAIPSLLYFFPLFQQPILFLFFSLVDSIDEDKKEKLKATGGDSGKQEGPLNTPSVCLIYVPEPESRYKRQATVSVANYP